MQSAKEFYSGSEPEKPRIRAVPIEEAARNQREMSHPERVYIRLKVRSGHGSKYGDGPGGQSRAAVGNIASDCR